MTYLSVWFRAHPYLAAGRVIALLSFWAVFSQSGAGLLVVRYEAWRDAEARLGAVSGGEQQALLQRKTTLLQTWQALYVSLPRADESSQVLGAIRAAAENSGASLTEVRPGARVSLEDRDEWPFELTLTGAFGEVVAAMNELEQSRYLMQITGVDLRPGDSGKLVAKVSVRVVALPENRGER